MRIQQTQEVIHIDTLINFPLSFILQERCIRVEFARLGEVRSLIHSHVNVLALTATATSATRKAVVKRLSMKNPEVISLMPDKPKLIYILRDKPKTIEEAFLPIVEKIQHHEIPPNDKIIIFCCKCD